MVPTIDYAQPLYAVHWSV